MTAMLVAAVAIALGPAAGGVAIGLLANPLELAAMAASSCGSIAGVSAPGGTPTVPETSGIVVPLGGPYRLTDGFGPRIDPITGQPAFHRGQDFAAPTGTPILAAMDGVVTIAEPNASFGNLIVIQSTVDGAPVATGYAHMWDDEVYVTAGQIVTAGQVIGGVGAKGHATGPHLHFEVHPGGWSSPAVDPLAWLQQHGVIVNGDGASCGTTP